MKYNLELKLLTNEYFVNDFSNDTKLSNLMKLIKRNIKKLNNMLNEKNDVVRRVKIYLDIKETLKNTLTESQIYNFNKFNQCFALLEFSTQNFIVKHNNFINLLNNVDSYDYNKDILADTMTDFYNSQENLILSLNKTISQANCFLSYS